MLKEYFPLLLLLLAATGTALSILVASSLVSNRKRTRGKGRAYECGMEPVGDARRPFGARFYVTAVLFILFDIEAVFLIPWAMSLRPLGPTMGVQLFLVMFIFLAILGLGLVYVWRKGGLDWRR